MSDAYEQDREDNAYHFHSAVDDDQPEEEQEERIREKRSLIVAIADFLKHSQLRRAHPFWKVKL